MNVLPIVIFAVITALCVVGNFVYMLETVEHNTKYQYKWWLWGIKGCPVLGTCVTYDAGEFDRVVGKSDDCQSLVKQFRAAEVFAVVSAVCGGFSTMLSAYHLYMRDSIAAAKMVSRGQLMSGLQFASCLQTFVIMVTFPQRSCITALRSQTTYEAATFLFLGGMVLALVNIFVFIRLSSVEKKRAATVRLAEMESLAQSPEPAVLSPLPPTSGVTERRVASPARASPIPFSNAHTQEEEVTQDSQPLLETEIIGDEMRPVGDDWELDADSGLLWSVSKQHFFDLGSGQFYNPITQLWFDPVENTWHTLEAAT